MSERKEKTRRALYAKMNTAAVYAAGATGIYHMSPPNPPNYPVVVLRDWRVLPITYKWGGAVLTERIDWAIVALVGDSTNPAQGAIAQAEAILKACETAIGSTLTLTGAKALEVERLQDLRSDQSIIAGQTIQHRGFILKTVIS